MVLKLTPMVFAGYAHHCESSLTSVHIVIRRRDVNNVILQRFIIDECREGHGEEVSPKNCLSLFCSLPPLAL